MCMHAVLLDYRNVKRVGFEGELSRSRVRLPEGARVARSLVLLLLLGLDEG